MKINGFNLSPEEVLEYFQEEKKVQKGILGAQNIPSNYEHRARIIRKKIHAQMPAGTEPNLVRTRISDNHRGWLKCSPLYRAIDGFFDEDGEIREIFLEKMREEHEQVYAPKALQDMKENYDKNPLSPFFAEIDENTSIDDWEMKVLIRRKVLRGIQEFSQGFIDPELFEYFGITLGDNPKRRREYFEKLYGQLQKHLTNDDGSSLRTQLQNFFDRLLRYFFEICDLGPSTISDGILEDTLDRPSNLLHDGEIPF